MRDIKQGDKSVYSENGNVTVNYAEKHIPKNLTRPPFISDVFIGRDDDIDAVHRQLFNDKPLLLLVNGEGGIGKTTLAAHYYSSYEDHYQHLAWVFAEDNLLDAVLTLAPPLQIVFPPDCPAPQRLDGLLAGMADLHKPCLLVIDNANNLAELENYYSALRACSNFHILMTTRITEFEQVACHKIKPLPWENARALFKQHYPGHHPDEDPLLQKILVAVGYNTLVIELLAKNLHNHNRLKIRYSLNDLFNDLQHKGLLKLNGQSVSSAYHSNGAALRKETPEAIIAAMYDLGELSDAEQALMSVFAVLPAENIAYSLLETLLPDIDNLDVTLLALAQKGWLDNIGSEFRVSPVVQEITRQKNQARLRQDCQNPINLLIEQLDYEIGTGHFINADYQQAALFARHAESLVCHIVEPTENLAILCERLGRYHQTTGNLDRALGFFEEYSRLRKALYEADPNNVSFKNGLAISYSKLGETHTALGHLDRALGFFEDQTELFKALYEAYPNNVSFKNGLAISYEKLGKTHAALGHLDRALGFYEDETELFKALNEAYPNNVSFKNGLAISYSKLGETHAALGRLDRALGFYEEYSRLGKALYEAYPDNVSFKNGLAISFAQLGLIFEKFGKKEKSKENFEQAKKLLEQLVADCPGYVEFQKNLERLVHKLSDE